VEAHALPCELLLDLTSIEAIERLSRSE